MRNFFDLDVDRAISFLEHLHSIDSPIKRMMVESMFRDAENMIETIRSDYIPRPDKPIINVLPIQSFHAAGMEGMIEISAGFIDHCLALPALPLHEIVKADPTDAPIPSNIPNPLFSWAVAHEYWHGLRRHNTALTDRENSLEHARAVEIDADLCAAASVYRWAQQGMAAAYSDATIRQIVFAALFWAMRHLPNSTGSDSHPEVLERIYHIQMKIAQITRVKGQHIDPSALSDESKQHIPTLINVAKAVDDIYRKDKPREADFLAFSLSFIEKKGWRTFTTPWDDLRTLVSVSSGTKA